MVGSSRQPRRAGGDGHHPGAEEQPLADGLADALGQAVAFGPRPRLDLDAQLGQGPVPTYHGAVLRHLREAADHRLQGARVYIIPADVDQPVRPPQEAAVKPQQRPPAGARPHVLPGQVAGAVAQHRAAPAPQVRHDHLAGLAGRHRPPRVRVEQFDQVIGLQHMQTAGRLGAFDAHGPDLGQAGVVEDAGAPGLLDAGARGRDTAARLAGNDEGAHRAPGQVEPLLAGQFRQAQGVGGGTQHHRGLVVQQEAQAGGAAHAAGGQAQAAEPARPVEGRPEAQERPEGEGEAQPVGGRHPGQAENLPPAAEHPVPALGGVQPAQRPAGGAGRLAQSGVALDRVGEDRAVGRVAFLVFEQLGLGGEGQAGQVGGGADVLGGGAGVPELAGVEAVAGQDLRQERPQAPELQGRPFRPAQVVLVRV
jgi:hypothetical protein